MNEFPFFMFAFRVEEMLEMDHFSLNHFLFFSISYLVSDHSTSF